MCEKRDRRYLLRLRKTANVKRLLERLFNRQDWTQASEARQGWQAIEDHLRLSGWSKERRVVVLRWRIKRDVALTGKRGDQGQQLLALGFDETQDDTQLWEYTVLVTDVAYDLNAISQLYRDRCGRRLGFTSIRTCRPDNPSGSRRRLRSRPHRQTADPCRTVQSRARSGCDRRPPPWQRWS